MNSTIYIQPIAFFILAVFLSTMWEKIIFRKRTKLKNILTIYLVMIFRLSEREAYSLLMSLMYYCYGILVSLTLVCCFRIDIISMFIINKEVLIMVMLGAMAELSVVGLFNSLFIRIHPTVNIAYEIRKVTWIDGISRLPHKFIPFALMGSAFIEELFFRGVLLMIFIQKMSVPPYLSLLAITFLFTYEQLLFLSTPVQKVVIGTTSIGISLVGGLLIFYTGSLIPAMIAHAFFVIFHFWETDIYT